jgi:serine/threonine-protein kinase
MGVVVAAQHVRLDEKVALKFLLPNAMMNAEVIGRFEREARAASKIKNEHVARVSDVGTLDNGSPYMVMEYLQGGDLSGWLTERGPMPIDMAVDFILQACEAIGEAHSIGIVHRDLKPANLFCTTRTDGQLFIKVLDFGISKLSTPGVDSHMTRTTAFLGSPLYMSPEQMQTSKGVDARTDIWSLGIILFELVTGRPPFDGESVTELAIKIATQPPIMVRTLRADAPVRFEQLLTKCLERDRDRRFQSVGELAVALGEFAPPHARVSVERIVGTERRAGMSITGDPTKSALPGVFVPGLVAPTGASQTAGPVFNLVPTRAEAPQTAASWGQTGAEEKSGSKGLFIGLGVFSAVVAVVGIAVFIHVRGASPSAVAGPSTVAADPASGSVAASPAPPASSPPSAEPAVAPAAPSTAAQAAAVPDPPAPTGPAAAPTVAAHATPSRPSPASQPPAAQAPAQPPAPAAVSKPAATPAGKPNCNPPYIIIVGTGERKYKPECL